VVIFLDKPGGPVPVEVLESVPTGTEVEWDNEDGKHSVRVTYSWPGQPAYEVLAWNGKTFEQTDLGPVLGGPTFEDEKNLAEQQTNATKPPGSKPSPSKPTKKKPSTQTQPTADDRKCRKEYKSSTITGIRVDDFSEYSLRMRCGCSPHQHEDGLLCCEPLESLSEAAKANCPAATP
jgi:hypothetical protein